MSSWNSALNAVLVRSARSTHSSPSTLRRVFMPRLYASLLIAMSSSKVGRQRGEELVDRRLQGLRAGCGAFAVSREVGLHAVGVHDERCRDEVEEVQASAQRGREFPPQRVHRLHATKHTL